MNTEYTQPSQPFDPDQTMRTKVDKNQMEQAQNSASIPAPMPRPAPQRPAQRNIPYGFYEEQPPQQSTPLPHPDDRTQMAYAQTPQPRTYTNQRDRTWLYLFGGLAALGLITVFIFAGLVLFMTLATPRIANGVVVGGVNVGGETVEDATGQLSQAFAAMNVTVTDGVQQWQVPLSDLGITANVEAMLESAQNASQGANVPMSYNFDAVQAQNGLIAISDQVSVPAVDGNPPKNGTSVEIPVLLDRLVNHLDAELADGVIELPMIETQGVFIPESGYTGTPSIHVVQPGQELGLISKEYNVSIQDIVTMNNITNPDLLYVGQELQIPAAGVYAPSAEDAPVPPTTTGKAIVVSTQDQRIYAYENGQLVRSHLTSTGRPETPTVLGDYKVYVKHVATDMRGADYFLPAVPYTMYFYQGYGIHGTYWHNNFGRVMSHGCVNLPIEEAQWFFEWAEVGTPVRVV